MLIISRKVGEGITIGEDVHVFLLEIKERIARIAVDAPRHVNVHRQELFSEIQPSEPTPSLEAPAETIAQTERQDSVPPSPVTAETLTVEDH